MSSARAASLCRERCSSCYKFVYKHQPVFVCCFDGNIYHGSCLGFGRDSCFHIQSGTLLDWFCPNCSCDIFPFFDSYEWSDNILCVCAACCNARTNSESVFNPFEVDSDHNSNVFDDSMCDALTTADSILSNCKCRPINELQVYDNTFSTLYFHNIDGFKSNFHESLINIKSINYSPSILSFCETNLKRDDPEDYSISGYNSEHLYAISDKKRFRYTTILLKNPSI